MQRCVYYLNKYSGPSAKERCTKLAIASPTPTTVCKRFRIIITADNQRTWGLALIPDLEPLGNSYRHIEGYYSTGRLESINSDTLHLPAFIHVAKEKYQLSDYNALQLLGFFKFNSTLAYLHLGGIGGQSKMRLELDSPWRIGFPTIIQQSGTHTFLPHKKHPIINTELVVCILPTKLLFKKFASRSLRIQRTHHNGRDMWVCCALPDPFGSFKINAVLMPAVDTGMKIETTDLIKDLEQIVLTLVLASKSWNITVPKRRVTDYQLIAELSKTLYDFLVDITSQPIRLTTLLPF